MKIAVLLRAVPDPVEELELSDDGTDLDRDFLGYVLNEFDDHALEEALLLKDETGAEVSVWALGTADEVEQMLYTAPSTPGLRRSCSPTPSATKHPT